MHACYSGHMHVSAVDAWTQTLLAAQTRVDDAIAAAIINGQRIAAIDLYDGTIAKQMRINLIAAGYGVRQTGSMLSITWG